LSEKFEHGHPGALTCPDCDGPAQETAGVSPHSQPCDARHHCDIDCVDSSQVEPMHKALMVAFHTLIERADLCRRMAETSKAGGHTYSAERWEKSWREAEDRANVLRRFLGQG
jgi:two-component system, chemotaxis family, protein-glutamate methylesterase/glutaminase